MKHTWVPDLGCTFPGVRHHTRAVHVSRVPLGLRSSSSDPSSLLCFPMAALLHGCFLFCCFLQ